MSLEISLIDPTPTPTLPINSLAALLPPETLAHIAACAFENLSPLERQRERFSYSKLCQSWYLAIHSRSDYVVSSRQQVQNLIKKLEEDDAGEQVMRLVILGAGIRMDEMVKLLLLCVMCRELSIESDTGSTRNAEASFTVFCNALEALVELRRCHLFIRGPGLPLDKPLPLVYLLRAWKHIEELALSGDLPIGNGPSDPSYAQHLRRLNLSSSASSPTGQSPFRLFHTHRRTLREITIGPLRNVDFQDLDLLRTSLFDSAPHLHALALLDVTWNWLTPVAVGNGPTATTLQLKPILERCVNLRVLRIDLSNTIADVSTLFYALESLQHLQQLTLSTTIKLEDDLYHLIPYSSFETFVKSSHAIRSISIPYYLMHAWNESPSFDINKLARIIRKRGVAFEVGNAVD